MSSWKDSLEDFFALPQQRNQGPSHGHPDRFVAQVVACRDRECGEWQHQDRVFSSTPSCSEHGVMLWVGNVYRRGAETIFRYKP